MADVRKHRLERKSFAHDFGPQLAADDTLTGTPTVKVIRGGSNVTSQFGVLDPAIDGTFVVFTLHPAAASQQDGGTYTLLIECDTTAGEHLVAEVQDGRTGEFRRPLLEVHEDGDLSAP